MTKEEKCCASCHFCYTEESFDDVFPACELYLHMIDDPDHECCDQYNICMVDDLNQKCKECWFCKHDDED